MLLLLSAGYFQDKLFQNTIIVSNSLYPDQDRHSVGTDPSPKLFAKTKVTSLPPSKGANNLYKQFRHR